MKTITQEQLKEKLASHKKYLLGEKGGERADFVLVDFVGMDLSDLRSADLYGANLYGADLYGANLRSANLYGANLYGANLYGADLYGADLYGADLYGANLRSANLRSADLYGANLRSANLYGANLYGANLGSKTSLGRQLALIGACSESIAYVDAQPDHSDPMALLNAAPSDYYTWLKNALGGEPTVERLRIVVEFVLSGRFDIVTEGAER